MSKNILIKYSYILLGGNYMKKLVNSFVSCLLLLAIVGCSSDDTKETVSSATEKDTVEETTVNAETEVNSTEKSNVTDAVASEDILVRMEYEIMLSSEITELMDLWKQVNEDNMMLGSQEYYVIVADLSERLLNDIEYYRNTLGIPEGPEYLFFSGYMDEAEQAVKKLLTAAETGNVDLVKEVENHITTAFNYYASFTAAIK
jgi:Fe-S cluster assembly iron-binding protein IscA